MKVALLSPLPARIDQLPESGVAAYSAALASALSHEAEITVLAQLTANLQTIGNARVMPTWTPDLKLPAQVRLALRKVQPDLLHVQHEFNLYGGLIQGAWLTAALIAMRRQGPPIVTTVHGVVDPLEVGPSFLRRNSLGRSVRIARMGFRAAYRALAASSDVLVVHHDHFRNVLVDSYQIAAQKVHTIKPGTNLVPNEMTTDMRRPEVLTLGFLTGYKLPEIVAEVAESAALPGVTFRFCVGRNPRLRDRASIARYEDLERKVRRLGGRAVWSGYIPDEELSSAFSRAAVLVLPYTECVSASAVAAAAQRSRTPICYSRALRPLFGSGPFEFELDASSLTEALMRVFAGAHEPVIDQFIPWTEVAALTANLWRQLPTRLEPSRSVRAVDPVREEPRKSSGQ